MSHDRRVIALNEPNQSKVNLESIEAGAPFIHNSTHPSLCWSSNHLSIASINPTPARMIHWCCAAAISIQTITPIITRVVERESLSCVLLLINYRRVPHNTTLAGWLIGARAENLSTTI